MTRKDFVELLIDDRDGNIHRKLPGGKKLYFIAKPKEARNLAIIPEHETFGPKSVPGLKAERIPNIPRNFYRL
ncbi:hypothetical protein [Leadbettera azotonutricia]|uniref:Uncharacterized protein n=1 Tax=Leadbettera azotonutricia (strain ATCC BAA-888 / DSM 13862 / ZAS-9) TaxID=545695 RepID=F5Y9P6_LEAAZ|nr:hypothetical protein [Leadbettera azotonutricia]AEF82701.1 hypothetical protein TREAZ_0782 [Leadbettera azotonutricia ZAS-9]